MLHVFTLVPFIFALPALADSDRVVRSFDCEGEVSSLANNTKPHDFKGTLTDIKTDSGYKTTFVFKADAKYAFYSDVTEADPITVRDANPDSQTDELGQFLKDDSEPQNYFVVQAEEEQINKKFKKYYIAYGPTEQPSYQWLGDIYCKP